MGFRLSLAVSAALSFVSLFTAPSPARSDAVPSSLGELIEGADHVVIGTVSTVVPGPLPGSQLATVAVEEELLGTPTAPEVTLPGSTREPFVPSFTVGERVLAFLAGIPPGSTDGAIAAAILAGGDELATIGGQQGAIDIPPEAIDVTRSVVRKVIDLGPALQLGDVREELGRTPALPDGLDLALLEELGLHVAASDAPLLTEIACNSAAFFSDEAQSWAISGAGVLAVSEARPCLEEIVDSAARFGDQLAAVEALGDLADPLSVAVLADAIDRKAAKGLRQSDGGLAVAVTLALGKIGDPKAIKVLKRLLKEGDDLALQSSIVHALARIGGKKVVKLLDRLGEEHPDARIRTLATAAADHVSDRLESGGNR